MRTPEDVEIVAHRGASAHAPENTLGAVNLAWEMGADAVEIDVRLSADGQLVVIHDETLERVSNRSEPVNRLTTQELRNIDVGSWFSDEWASERVVLLEDIVRTVPLRRRLFVEFKCVALQINAVVSALRSIAKLPQEVTFIGFDGRLMKELKACFPHCCCYLVAQQNRSDAHDWTPSTETLIAQTATLGLDGLDLSNTPAVDQSAVEKIHRAGLHSCVWTVRSVEDARRLIDAGVQSLTMDDPQLLQA